MISTRRFYPCGHRCHFASNSAASDSKSFRRPLMPLPGSSETRKSMRRNRRCVYWSSNCLSSLMSPPWVVDGESAARGLLVLRLHIGSSLPHGLDRLIETHPVVAIAVHRHPSRASRHHGGASRHHGGASTSRGGGATSISVRISKWVRPWETRLGWSRTRGASYPLEELSPTCSIRVRTGTRSAPSAAVWPRTSRRRPRTWLR